MRTTVEAEVDDQGSIRPTEPLELAPGAGVLVTVLELLVAGGDWSSVAAGSGPGEMLRVGGT